MLSVFCFSLQLVDRRKCKYRYIAIGICTYLVAEGVYPFSFFTATYLAKLFLGMLNLFVMSRFTKLQLVLDTLLILHLMVLRKEQ